MNQLIYFAASETAGESTDFLGALGIDWRLIIVQLVSFFILLAVLRKFVYPILNKALDEREKSIAASVEAAERARDDAAKAEATIAGQIAAAKKEAANIVDTAHKEAAAMIEAAESRAGKKADHIIESAKAQLDVDVRKAREELRKDTIELVVKATETIIGEKLDSKKDQALITDAMKAGANER